MGGGRQTALNGDSLGMGPGGFKSFWLNFGGGVELRNNIAF